MAGIKIKLVVDKTRERILFADAGSDFVDLLLTFLTLPLSAVQLTAGASSPGCLANLCASVHHLGDNKLLKGEACHGMLLRPTHTQEFGCSPPCCSRCTPFVAQGGGCTCWQVMARLVHVFNQSERAGVFSKWKERFVISDDWVIKPAATSTVLSFLRGFGADGIKDAHEAEVNVGWTEVVSLLKTCTSSTTIFTDVFLTKGVGGAVRPALINRSVLTIQKPRRKEASDDPRLHMSIKLFFDRQDMKVMYAECKHDFVDLILSFLTYPMGCIVKNLAGRSHRFGSFNNLYSSAADLNVSGLLTGSSTLLDPSFAPLKTHGGDESSEKAIAEWYYLCRTGKLKCSCEKDKSACHLCNPGLVDDHTYIVDDELRVHQASAMSVLKHWCKRDRDKVVEMDIAISKQEAVALLRAAINSRTALTDAFKVKLDQAAAKRLPPWKQTCSPCVGRQMQIFVKIPSGETITLDVASSYTIAAVRSKIQTREKLTRSYGLVYGGKILQDPWTLADCGVRRESTIHAEFDHRAP